MSRAETPITESPDQTSLQQDNVSSLTENDLDIGLGYLKELDTVSERSELSGDLNEPDLRELPLSDGNATSTVVVNIPPLGTIGSCGLEWLPNQVYYTVFFCKSIYLF